MITTQALKELGCNTEEGLSRCLNNEAFFLRLVPAALEETRYRSLDEKIGAGDLKGAFEDAHSLKGVLANLSLTPLYEVVSGIAELLRTETDTDYRPLLDKMWDIKGKFDELI